MKKLVQCVPNYSEGKDLEKIEKIAAPFKKNKNIKFMGCEPDADYNRTVITVIGEPEDIIEAVVESVGIAAELIDMNVQRGEHLRMGATDVVPFIPIKGITMAECVEISKIVAEKISSKFNIPIFLYEESATAPNRVSLPSIRKGEFEGMAEKLKLEEWAPDFGERAPHPTAGVTAVGGRMPLIAYNINLEKGFVQVTMNIKDFKKNPIYRVFETVKMEAKRYGVNVIGSEIIGAVPMEALSDSIEYYLGLEGFSVEKIIENELLK